MLLPPQPPKKKTPKKSTTKTKTKNALFIAFNGCKQTKDWAYLNKYMLLCI
jgi:hypothetical protein